MRDGFEVIDADCHVLEPSDLFANYLPEKFVIEYALRDRINCAAVLMNPGCGWVPFWLERMDEHWEHEGHGSAKTIKEKPSYYFKRQCWASCEAGEELAPVFVEHVGAEHLTIATDYPRSDCIGKFPDRTVGDLTNNHDLPMAARRKILWDNAIRLYGLEV